MTQREKIEKEIKDLRHTLSVIIPQEMQDAASRGNLSENTEYSNVLEHQRFVTIRLEQLVRQMDIINRAALQPMSSADPTAVAVNTTIKVRNLKTKKLEHLAMVATFLHDEVNDKYTYISIGSPMGQALLGKRIKEEVNINLPNGKNYKCRILRIMNENHII